MGILRLYSERKEESLPITSNASAFVIARSRLRGLIGSILNRLPAFVSDAEITDDFTGQEISIKRNPRFTVISVNGRDYYFKRFSGKFDGTGYQVRC